MKQAPFWIFLASVAALLAVLGAGLGLFDRPGAGSALQRPPVQAPLALPPPTASVPAVPISEVRVLAGTWVPEKPGGGGLTRIEIRAGRDGPEVRMWGSCRPKDCDWGAPQSYNRDAMASGVLALVWNHGFSIRDQELRLLADGRLEVVTRTRFTDNSGRPDYELREAFRKSAPH